ncbi:MAG: UTP--glucose-1-phosphate uridylyltransferase, partial [Rhabdochlamydiaceae bacterium]
MFYTLAQELSACKSLHEKINLLSTNVGVKDFLNRSAEISSIAEKLEEPHRLVLFSLIAAGQGERLLTSVELKKVTTLLDQLAEVEQFYASIGGLIGYHARMLELLSNRESAGVQKSRYLAPEGISIAEKSAEWALEGIRSMPEMAEMYPLGGAADRLRLYDEKTHQPLPAARLPFLGVTLLEGLISDLQAREYLHYKVFKKQLTTPVAIMTSHEKNNHEHITEICQEAGWFGRPKEMFRLFCQPLVPTINREGSWCLQGPQQLLMKPGGHGVLWRLAQEEGVLSWMQGLGRKKAVVRQVNNPVANTDDGLLSFTGIGCKGNKRFGFASCPRQVKASEGVNVLIENASEEGFNYTLTNIEYCDFKKFGIHDTPERPGSSYSKFPSNTNILFVDIDAVLEAVKRCPIPGILVNMKKITYRTADGAKKDEEAARLESTMQNLADFMEETFAAPLKEGNRDALQTYLTYNHRRKTISAVKREFTLGSSLLETPEGCFLDILQNVRDVLTTKCHVQVPPVSDPIQFFESGPSFIALYHPALGPLYSVIGQKWRGGKLHTGSEVQLQISEIDFENLIVNGSLLVQAESIMGHHDAENLLVYSERVGRCVLKNVTVANKGIDHDLPNVYWKNEIARQEVCHIL